MPDLIASKIVEKLLDVDGPIWYRWDQNLPALLTALAEKVRDISSSNPSTQEELHRSATCREKLLWLLDRLAPASDSGVFVPYLDHPRGVYAWGRRLPPERRKELIDFPIPDGPPGDWMLRQALVFAWCDSCPDALLNTLVEDLHQWRGTLRREYWYAADPIEEFCHRCTDPQGRGKQLEALLQRTLASSNDREEPLRTIAWRTWTKLLQYIALAHPFPEPLLSEEEAWDAWFTRTLSAPEFTPCAELGRRLLEPRPYIRGIAQLLWIWRHGKDDWEELYTADRMRADLTKDPVFFERLSEIVPTDKLDFWEGFFRGDCDLYRIQAFCRWLPEKYAEVLRDHFNYPERDWAACAYQNYLAKGQQSILEHYFNQVEDLPGWQAQLLDRRLFAPEPIRPGPIVEDIQAVEGDLRLQDPFNHRRY